MITVFKYLVTPETFVIRMPANSIILSAVNQNEQIVIYAQVDTEAPIADHKITCLMTGEQMHSAMMTFVGTVLLKHIVVHVFDRGEK